MKKSLGLGVDMGRAVDDLYVECGCQKINSRTSLVVKVQDMTMSPFKTGSSQCFNRT